MSSTEIPQNVSGRPKRNRRRPARFRTSTGAPGLPQSQLSVGNPAAVAEKNVPDIFGTTAQVSTSIDDDEVMTEHGSQHEDVINMDCQSGGADMSGQELDMTRAVLGSGAELFLDGGRSGDNYDGYQRDMVVEDDSINFDTYEPPETLVLNRGRATGSVRRVSASRAQLSIRYFVTTAIACPCEDSSCTTLVNVGRWGRMGTGSTVCVHCKHLRKGEWLGVGYGFMGKEDLVRHLKTAQCRAARGLEVTRTNIKQALGEQVVYSINNPGNRKRKREGTDNFKEYFKCPRCNRECLWRSRFAHCLKCYSGGGTT